MNNTQVRKNPILEGALFFSTICEVGE
jgi:hypothetical protein